ncbi:hypothetical protein [Oceanospirillum sanctuarii]|uniref:hypothetical protein n=1 Tax=Oceanospirillum sanctuarii TaxID=1434821 RepID=UPI000A3C858D|nr:hypothetical protein [Oceanospirillum sanctuarii]
MKQVLLVLWVIAAGTLGYLVDAGQSDNSKVFGNLPVYVVNNSDSEIPLFSESDARKQVSQISSGEHFLYLYAGDSGSFWYGIHDGKRVLIKDEARRKSFRLLNTNIFFPTLTEAGAILLGLSAFMLLVSFKGNQSPSGKRKPNQRTKVEVLQQQLKKLEHEKAESDKCIQELKEKYDQATEYLAEKFRNEVNELNQQINRDTEPHFNVQLEQIQAAYDQLNARYRDLEQDYNQFLQDSTHFGIDFNQAGYEQILKGRQFELYFAREMTRKHGANILEWTSDKGIDNGIRVESNGNPDFVFKTALGHRIAVECKFRGTAFNDKGVEKLSWAQDWQAERYQRYAQNNGVPVFLAIGFGEDSSNPNSVSLFELNELIELSDRVAVKDRGIQLMIAIGNYQSYLFNSESFHSSVNEALSYP